MSNDIKIGTYPTDNRPYCFCGCMEEIHEPKYKESCYFYYAVRDLGGRIPTCNYYNELGYCPCDTCGKFIGKGEIYGIVKKMVDERIPE